MPPAQLLGDIDERLATSRVEGVKHSIAEIVAHLNFWQRWFLKRVKGEAEPMATSAAVGWPPVEAGSWEALREEFIAGMQQVADYADDREFLRASVTPAIEFPPLADYTHQDALIHVALHNSHHHGQVVTLRQVLGAWPGAAGSWTW